jgi:hypothetical protein
MTSFQFSPVRIINIVITELIVVEKSYLDSLPSESINLYSARNYLHNNDPINKYNIIRIPKFLIAVNDLATAPISFFSSPHFLKILNILSSLNALSIFIYGVSPGVK